MTSFVFEPGPPAAEAGRAKKLDVSYRGGRCPFRGPGGVLTRHSPDYSRGSGKRQSIAEPANTSTPQDGLAANERRPLKHRFDIDPDHIHGA